MSSQLLSPPVVAAPSAPGREDADDRAEVRLGYGACSVSGCNCQGYQGSGSTCANAGCGHSYTDHW
jgi:hypothetical protein